MVETEEFQKELEEVEFAGENQYEITVRFKRLFNDPEIFEKWDTFFEKALNDLEITEEKTKLIQAFIKGFNKNKQ